MTILEGYDNYGQLRSKYCKKIYAMSDEELFKETKTMIWLSVYALNNRNSDYHWQANVCREAWSDRGKPEELSRASKEVWGH